MLSMDKWNIFYEKVKGCFWTDEWDIDKSPIVFDDKKEIYV